MRRIWVGYSGQFDTTVGRILLSSKSSNEIDESLGVLLRCSSIKAQLPNLEVGKDEQALFAT